MKVGGVHCHGRGLERDLVTFGDEGTRQTADRPPYGHERLPKALLGLQFRRIAPEERGQLLA